jgi:hypothetical protein
MASSRRLSGQQITAIVVALCVAVVAAPVGVMAATGSLVNISDPVTASHKARVDKTGALKVGGTVTANVPGTVKVAGGVTATIPGTVNVSGSVTANVPNTVNVGGTVTANVPNTVNVAGTVTANVPGIVTQRPAIPDQAFSHMWQFVDNSGQYIVLPANKTFAITSLTLANNSNAPMRTDITVNTEASANCGGALTMTAWIAALVAQTNNSASASYATPIVVPAAASERCIAVYAPVGSNAAYVTLTGYFS